MTGGDRGPRVRMIGGKGDDTLDATGAGKAKLSDSDGHNRAIAAALDDEPYHAPAPPKNAPWIPARDFTRETWVAPASRVQRRRRRLPRATRSSRSATASARPPTRAAHRLTGGCAFQQEGGHVEYQGDFRRENSRSSFSVHAYASAVEVLRFYGFGNETEAPEGQDYYQRSRQRSTSCIPPSAFAFGSGGELHVGPALKYTSNDQSRGRATSTR